MIEVQNLTRYYGDFAALKNVSFRIDDGQIIGLLGLNGAGKSTTLKVLAGLIPPSSGTVTINGIDVVDAPDSLKSSIGYLPESPPLYKDMTVTDFLRYVGRIKGMSAAEANARIPDVITLAGLQGREHQVIETLSHGYKKRVGIAQAVIHDPKLVILDEPISGLDPAQIKEMREVIKSLRAGRVVIVSSHILGEISQTCDRVLVLKDGQLIAEGTEEDFVKRQGHNQVVVTVRGARDTFSAWLDAHALVKSHTVDKSDAETVTATLELDGDSREDLVVDLANSDFGLRLLEDPHDELEEIFLDLTKKGAV